MSRERILEIARRAFAAHGYEKTTVRGIAREAGVDPAMVLYLFGSKDQLFRTCIRLMIDPDVLVTAIRNGEGSLGERFVRAYLSLWEQPGTVDTMRAIIASATTNDDANQAFRDYMQNVVLATVSAELPKDRHTRTRLVMAAAPMIGTVLLRYVMRIDPLASLSLDELVTLLAPTVERYLAGDPAELGLPEETPER